MAKEKYFVTKEGLKYISKWWTRIRMSPLLPSTIAVEGREVLYWMVSSPYLKEGATIEQLNKEAERQKWFIRYSFKEIETSLRWLIEKGYVAKVLIQDIIIGKPTKKVGRKYSTRFRQNRRQKTQSSLALKRIR